MFYVNAIGTSMYQIGNFVGSLAFGSIADRLKTDTLIFQIKKKLFFFFHFTIYFNLRKFNKIHIKIFVSLKKSLIFSFLITPLNMVKDLKFSISSLIFEQLEFCVYKSKNLN